MIISFQKRFLNGIVLRYSWLLRTFFFIVGTQTEDSKDNKNALNSEESSVLIEATILY